MIEQSRGTAIVEARQITRDFKTPGGVVQVLRGIDLQIRPGEFVALRGRSGSGKTTLLNILVGLDDPSGGQVHVLDQDLARMNEGARARLRREKIGLLFQNAHLFPVLTAQENVEVSLRLQSVPNAEREERALKALATVGLSERADHRTMELSGGEQQRVALARALVHQPRFIIADEPTGNLDSLTAHKIVELFSRIVKETGIGLLVATHDRNVVGSADRVLNINDGRLAEGY